MVEKDRLVLWSLNTTNLKSAIDQSEQRHCDGLQCVYGKSNTNKYLTTVGEDLGDVLLGSQRVAQKRH